MNGPSRVLFCLVTISVPLLATDSPNKKPTIAYQSNDRALILRNWQAERILPKPEGLGSIQLPGSWYNWLPDNDLSAIIAFSTEFILKESPGEIMVLSLGMVGIADEVYVNGRLIGKTGSFPQDDNLLHYRHLSWHADRKYKIPPSLLRPPGEPNTINIIVFSHIVSGISIAPRLQTQTNYLENSVIRRYITPFENNALPILTTVLLIYLVLSLTANGYNSLVLPVIFLGMANLIRTALVMGDIEIENGLTRMKIIVGFFPVVELAMLIILQRFLNIRIVIYHSLFVLALPAFWIVIGLIDRSTQLVSTGSFVFIAIVVSYLGLAFFWATRAAYRDILRYWYLIPFGVILLLGAAYDIIMALELDFHRIQFQFAWRFPGIMALFLVFLFLELSQVRIERDSLRSRLEQSANRPAALNGKPDTEENRTDPRYNIHNLVRYLEQNFRETYDRIGLATRFHMNEDYMVQLFKKTTGMTISSFINEKRITEAMRLLEETESRVIDIAFNVGYDNLTYFYRQFKIRNNQSPVNYRKGLKKAANPADVTPPGD